MKTGFSQSPRVIRAKCIGCRICVESCPEKVITMEGNKHKHAHIDTKSCIRCYCCHELCPQKAIELRKSLVSHIIKV